MKHGKPAERLCNKDPFTLKSTKYLIDLFPNARFILMLRDGRATAHSIISRQVTISGFDITSYRDVLTKVGIHPPPCIGSQMRMKNSVGEECVMKFLGSREGFYRVCSIDDSASEYAPLIGSYGLQLRFCPAIG